MPKINSDRGYYIGTSTVGIEMNDTSKSINFVTGAINNGPSILPIRSITTAIGGTLSSTDCILILVGTIIRGATNTIFLGNHSNGKTFYFRNLGGSSTGQYTISRSGDDLIRLGSTTSVTSFTVEADAAWSLTYDSSRTIWWAMRNGGNENAIEIP